MKKMTGRRGIPVAAGAEPQAARPIAPNGQYRYYYHQCMGRDAMLRWEVIQVLERF